jgi:hypothetical protein
MLVPQGADFRVLIPRPLELPQGITGFDPVEQGILAFGEIFRRRTIPAHHRRAEPRTHGQQRNGQPLVISPVRADQLAYGNAASPPR